MGFQTVDEILDFAIQDEKNAAAFYADMANKTDLTESREHLAAFTEAAGTEGIPISAVTGAGLTMDDLLARSAAVYDLTRRMNVGLGIARKDDYPPARAFDMPVQSGKLAGAVLDRAAYDQILDLYYARRGWSADGIPPEA